MDHLFIFYYLQISKKEAPYIYNLYCFGRFCCQHLRIGSGNENAQLDLLLYLFVSYHYHQDVPDVFNSHWEGFVYASPEVFILLLSCRGSMLSELIKKM